MRRYRYLPDRILRYSREPIVLKVLRLLTLPWMRRCVPVIRSLLQYHRMPPISWRRTLWRRKVRLSPTSVAIVRLTSTITLGWRRQSLETIAMSSISVNLILMSFPPVSTSLLSPRRMLTIRLRPILRLTPNSRLTLKVSVRRRSYIMVNTVRNLPVIIAMRPSTVLRLL